MNALKPDKNLDYIQWKSWDADQFGDVITKDNAVFSCELRRAGVTLTSHSSVLEVGFGNGAFAGWVRQKTTNYVGTESNPELIMRAQRANIEAYPATTKLDILAKGRSFDLIAIFDVIEHLEMTEITEILRSASRCLANEGRIIIRVPSGDSPFSGHLMNGDITHKTWLGRSAFYQLAALTGLEVNSVHDAAFPIFGFGAAAAIRRLIVVPARKVVGTIIRAIYYANEPVVISPTLVAVLQLNPSAVATAAP